MKNILMISTYFPPMAGIGTVRVTKYVKYLKKFNWNPTIVTISEKFIEHYDDTLLKDIDLDTKVIRLDFTKKNKESLEEAFYKSLRKNIDSILSKNKYDVIFITGGPFIPMKIAPYIYKNYKIPYIIDLRDPWKLQKINNTSLYRNIKSRIQKFIIGFYEKSIFKNAFAICTVNDTMTRQYGDEYKKWKDKFYTIPNGYDKEDYANIKPKKLNEFTIVYSGKFNVSAGFRDPSNLFEAINIVNKKGYKVKFVHIGQEEIKVINLAKEKDAEDYCCFLGRKSYKETLEYCKGANILVVIGGNEKSEQTGKIFDYIGCQRQILAIANKESEINKICETVPYANLVDKEDIDSIVNTIISIYENKQREITNFNIKAYEREELTYQLSQILDKIDMDLK